MEVVIIILALVFSIWSEINKKKQEENVDIDFSELSSLDDFFKKPSGAGNSSAGDFEGAAKKARPKKPAKRKSEAESVNYDQLPALTSRAAMRAKKEEVNYDELPSLTGRSYEQESGRQEINYDDLPTLTGQANSEDDIEDEITFSTRSEGNSGVGLTAEPGVEPGGMTFDRNDILKSFVMAEIMQRYKIERIYERIPAFRSDK